MPASPQSKPPSARTSTTRTGTVVASGERRFSYSSAAEAAIEDEGGGTLDEPPAD